MTKSCVLKLNLKYSNTYNVSQKKIPRAVFRHFLTVPLCPLPQIPSTLES